MSSKYMILSIFFLTNFSISFSQSSITAREFFDLTFTLAYSQATDVQLYDLHGIDVDTVGIADHWSGKFASFTEKQEVFWYEYFSGIATLDTITSVLIGPSVVDSNWINSERVIQIAELYGGKDYRKIVPNYKISLDLDSKPFPPIYTYWDIFYYDQDSIHPTFSVRINAVTEELITNIESTCKEEIVRNFEIFNNYPNPFNNSTVFHFMLNKQSLVKLIIYNTLGQKLDEVINEILSPNTHRIIWQSSDYSSGLYFYSLFVDDKKVSRTFILQK